MYESKLYMKNKGIEKMNIVSVSGGKDSTATLLVARERGVEHSAIFADTGNEHPTTYEYLEYLEKKLSIPIRRVKASFEDRIRKKRGYIKKHWNKPLKRTVWGTKRIRRPLTETEIAEALEVLRPTGNPMLDLFLWKGMMATPRQKFCSIELKQIPILEQVYQPLIDQGIKPTCWQGVRAEESRARSKMTKFEESPDGYLIYRPILHWTHKQVFEIAKRHGVKPNPLYEQGMSRVGCMPCINCSKRELGEIYRRFPEEIRRIAEWEKLIGRATRHPETREKGFYTYFAYSGLKNIVETAEAALISKPFDEWREEELFQESPDPDACSSIYPVVCE